MVDEQEDLGWLENAKAPVELKDMKGTIRKIIGPLNIKTKHGPRKMVQFIIEGPEGNVIANEYLPDTFPVLSTQTNIGKMLSKYECQNMKDLIWKEVELEYGNQGFLKVKHD